MLAERHIERAAKLIEEAGERATPARIRVLASLLQQRIAVTHHDIEAALGNDKMDRVTLYRALDWLVEHEFAHRLTSEDRIWRFMASGKNGEQHHHAHFHCTQCDKVICLEDVPVQANLSVPRGYKTQEAELTLKGVCDRCT